ncbi:HpcH/HpaI aldolase/citrate lyase family protein [Nocardia miyunensis]|uniref:HpcH/HpaI aldolase/citrate lyase family protein n=1 Tax=Nocardia miyunensis TaxID=282684 RepID=UPI000AC71F5A|nr:CoA ester lyase [Nocardia miyunensis]
MSSEETSRVAGANAALATARSFLFVPGDRPDRFDKAVGVGPDVVIIDLEDAVAADRKDAAREYAVEWLSRGGRAMVRVNGAGTAWHADDVEALRATGAPVMLPKAQSADVLGDVVARLGYGSVVALVETARGIRDIDAVCAAEGVVRVALGNVDLSAELGVDPDSHTALAHVRGKLVLGAIAAGLPAPIDGVSTAFDEPERLERDLAHAKELGFGGKLCIHPKQVSVVNDGFLPTEAEKAWAERILGATRGIDGVAVLDGAMIDAPVIRRAERLAANSAARPQLSW